MFRFNNMLILKITHDCNLRCEYCYIHDKDKYKGEMITFDIYKETIKRIIKDRLIQKTNDEVFRLVFHGGEPTMASKEFFIKMLLYAQDQFVKNGVRYNFSMQSNLTRIDKDYAQIFSRFDVGLGVSFDGIGDSNEARTKTFKEAAFFKKFNLLKKYNIHFGALLVAHSGNINNVFESVVFLEKEYGMNTVKVNYVEDVNGIGGEITGKEFFEKARKPFLEEYFNTYRLRESNLRQIINKFLTDFLVIKSTNLSTGNCGFKVCGGGLKIVEMEADGNFSFCGRYSEAFPEVHIENVKDQDIFSLHQIKRYSDFVKEKHKVINKVGCDTCIAASICDHGCMAFYYSKFKEWGTRTDLVCDIFKHLYEYLVINADRLIHAIFMENQKNGVAKISLTESIKEIKSNISDIVFSKYGLRIVRDWKRENVLRIEDEDYLKKIKKAELLKVQKIHIDNIVNIRENNKD